MFDIGWSEMAIIMLLALIIIGPKDLPRVARTIGQWVRKGRMLAREFQTSLEDMAKEAELDDVKKEIEKVGKTDLNKAVENTIDPKGDLKKAFDTTNSTSGEETVGKALNGSADAEAGKTAVKAESPAVAEAKAPAATVSKKKSASTAATDKKKPAAAVKKTASTAKKPAAKKTAAPGKRAAKPAPSAKAGAGKTASPAKSGAAVSAKSS